MAEILSQEEIDALLGAYGSGGTGTGANSRASSYEVRLYDFARPERFSKEQIRQLEVVHRGFASGLANYLSAFMRTGIEMDHTLLDQISFDEYLKSVPSPTLLSSFRLEPEGTRCLIEFNPNVALAMVDLLTGGNGDAYLQSREMTDIEVQLMESIIRSALQQYMRGWEQFGRVECTLERVGSNQMVNPICNAQDRVLCGYFETRVGSQVGLISLCIPTLAIEARFEEFGTRRAEMMNSPNTALRTVIADTLTSSQVTGSATLGHTTVSIGDLLNLAEGDFVRLDQSVNREITFCIQGIPKYFAVPGVVGRKLGIHITNELDDEGNVYDKDAA